SFPHRHTHRVGRGAARFGSRAEYHGRSLVHARRREQGAFPEYRADLARRNGIIIFIYLDEMLWRRATARGLAAHPHTANRPEQAIG
ncbi:hypothetical protein PMAYCL1PPCAC_08730, partial [Pristionchus mayeri]